VALRTKGAQFKLDVSSSIHGKYTTWTGVSPLPRWKLMA
jgi:hypothetical protein